MAHSLSALKRIRQSKKRHIKNRSAKASLKTLSNRFYDNLEENKSTEAEALLKTLYTEYDSKAKRGIIHRNVANRRKSRLTRAFNSSSKS